MLGLKWKATAKRRAPRSTYTTAFRAPSLSETSQGQVAGPRRSRARSGDMPGARPLANPNCVSSRVGRTSGFNPGAKSQARARSERSPPGTFVEPWRDASFTVDAFNIRAARPDQDYIDTAFLLEHEADLSGATSSGSPTARSIRSESHAVHQPRRDSGSGASTSSARGGEATICRPRPCWHRRQLGNGCRTTGVRADHREGAKSDRLGLAFMTSSRSRARARRTLRPGRRGRGAAR